MLGGNPRFVHATVWQSREHQLSTYTESDRACDKASHKSISGGIAFVGHHAVKSWPSNQSIIALSSAEAELNTLLEGASQFLGLQSMARDLRMI